MALEEETSAVPLNPQKMLISMQTALSVFPEEVNEQINQVLQSVDGHRADPWSMLDMVVQPLLVDDPATPVQVVISVQALATLLGSMQARFDDLRAQLPVARADQLDALRGEARTKWLAGVQRLRREYDGPTGPRG